MSLRIDPFTFEPAVLSIPELKFLLDHLEEPPHAALHGEIPPGVNPIQITKTLTEFQHFDQLQKFRGVEWAGFEAIRDSILRFLEWDQRRLGIFEATGGPRGQNAISNASQFAFSEDGSAFKYAISADSAEMTRTEILDDGSRRAFGVPLAQAEGVTGDERLGELAPWIKRSKSANLTSKDSVETNTEGKNGTVRCSICGHTESFKTAERGKFLAARGRMARHLKQAKDDVARHRLLYRKAYESRTAKV